ncbi:hypothetical protein CRYUN_Cryun23aG0025600 [Craigia yunnanensis]
MLKEETRDGSGGNNWACVCDTCRSAACTVYCRADSAYLCADGSGGNNWARVCDTCRFPACTVYCRADSAYLCAGCDDRVHAANRVTLRHERVCVCEPCERAPAAFLCKADAASLWCLYDPSATDQGGRKIASAAETEDGFMATEGDETLAEEDEDEVASWLLLNPGKNTTNQNNGFLFSGEVDEYLDLVEYNSIVQNEFTDQYNQQQHYGVPHKSYGGDSVVPVQSGEVKGHLQQQQHQSFQYGLDYDSSKAAYSYNGSISHSVSISSVDFGFEPESTMSDISISRTRPPKSTIDLFSGPPIQMPPQLTPMDREARVLR